MDELPILTKGAEYLYEVIARLMFRHALLWNEAPRNIDRGQQPGMVDDVAEITDCTPVIMSSLKAKLFKHASLGQNLQQALSATRGQLATGEFELSQLVGRRPRQDGSQPVHTFILELIAHGFIPLQSLDLVETFD